MMRPVDICAESRPARTRPDNPAGMKFFTEKGRISSKSMFAPISFNRGLKKANASATWYRRCRTCHRRLQYQCYVPRKERPPRKVCRKIFGGTLRHKQPGHDHTSQIDNDDGDVNGMPRGLPSSETRHPVRPSSSSPFHNRREIMSAVLEINSRLIPTQL